MIEKVNEKASKNTPETPVQTVNPDGTPVTDVTPRVFTSAEAAEAATSAEVTSLPDPGYARDEELRKRGDALDELSERLAAQQEMFALDISSFDEDRELQNLITRDQRTGTYGYFASENLDHKHFRYKGVQIMYPENSRGRWYAEARQAGWLPVRLDDVNLENRRPVFASQHSTSAAHGLAISYGDCVLMKLPVHRAEVADKADRIMRLDKIERTRSAAVIPGGMDGGGGIMHTDPSDPRYQQFLGSRIGGAVSMAPVMTEARKEIAKAAADNIHHADIRNGTVPGAPAASV